VIVSTFSGRVVAGHGRIEAARLLGVATVPIERQAFAGEVEEREFLLADNRLAELSERDNAALKDLLEQLDTGETDMDLTGYSEEDRERLATQFHRELAERIAEEPVYTTTDTKADRRAAKIAERLTTLAKNHKPQLESAAAIVISADCPEFLCIEDAALPDFLAELRRYADQGTESPLATILEHAHKL
jgi:ParB-like chromosome segregation protein Spo0J